MDSKRLQFPISTLLLFTTLCAVSVAWYVDHLRSRRQYEAEMNRNEREFGDLELKLEMAESRVQADRAASQLRLKTQQRHYAKLRREFIEQLNEFDLLIANQNRERAAPEDTLKRLDVLIMQARAAVLRSDAHRKPFDAIDETAAERAAREEAFDKQVLGIRPK